MGIGAFTNVPIPISLADFPTLTERQGRAVVAFATALRDMGHDVHTVPEEFLTGRSDPDIWVAAQAEARFLITQDSDFSDARQFVPGTHAGILLVRFRTPGRLALTKTVICVFANKDESAWSRCVVVLTERKIRIHRP